MRIFSRGEGWGATYPNDEGYCACGDMRSMTKHTEQLDPIELALLDLDRAEQAGLFQRTSVSADELMRASGALGFLGLPKWALRVVPLAASVLLAVGVGSWMFQRELARVRDAQSGALTIIDAAVPQSDWSAFHESFTGPKGAQATAVGDYDYDSDGDVDIADFSKYQLALARMP